jgi:hypothetical protein
MHVGREDDAQTTTRPFSCMHVRDEPGARIENPGWPRARPETGEDERTSCYRARVPSPHNPFARRLERLYVQWEEFAADHDARILCWRIAADELRLIDAFVATEQHEDGGTLPELFIRSDVPFEGGWGFEIRQQLIDMHDTSVERGELDPANVWRPGPGGGDDRQAVFEALAGIAAALAGLAERVVLIALPQKVADVELWNAWLVDFAKRSPTEARMIVLDSVEVPRLHPLIEHGGQAVMLRIAGLDVPGGTAELVAARDAQTPDNLFRQLFVAIGSAAGKGDLRGAQQHARKALTLTRQQCWPHLEVAVRMAVGATAVAVGKPAEAIDEYHCADEAAQRSRDIEGVDADRLQLTAQLGLGSALLAGGAHFQAAQVYSRVTSLAEKLGDQAMLLECWRMSSYCHEQCGAVDDAWRSGLYAIRAGEALPAEQRPSSTLAWVGEAMLRLTHHAAHRGQRGSIDAKMALLLGRADWRSLARAEAGA